VVKAARFRCCFKGRALDESSLWPKLNPLNEKMLTMIYGKMGAISFINRNNEVDSTHYPHNKIAHLSANSARYNGILSISATGVDNGKGGGWEKIKGPHGGKVLLEPYISVLILFI